MKTAHIRDSLRIVIPAFELWDEEHEMFIEHGETTVTLVHSLVSISEWESKYHKAFLSDKYEKTPEMVLDYIKCMTIGPDVDPLVYNKIITTPSIYKQIEDYMGNSMTASYMRDDPTTGGSSRETMTSELIYYWMNSLNIWLECERWHINRLLTLIKVADRKNRAAQGKNGYKSSDMARSNAHMNRARKH